MSEVEETLHRIQTHKNVQGIVIVNGDGHIIRSTYTDTRTAEGENIARLISQLTAKAKSTIRDLCSGDELKFLRLKSKTSEILVAPDKEFMLIVVQGQKTDKQQEPTS